MLDALKRAYDMSKQIASLAVIVDAKDDRASRFYSDYGFVPFPESPNRVFSNRCRKSLNTSGAMPILNALILSLFIRPLLNTPWIAQQVNDFEKLHNRLSSTVYASWQALRFKRIDKYDLNANYS